MARFIPPRTRICSRAELLQRALDLGVHVERLESLANASFVARDDQLAHLFGQAGRAALRLRRAEQACDLRVDVERRLAAVDAAIAAGGHHLANFELTLGPRRGAVGRWREQAATGFAVAHEASFADLVVGGPAREEEHQA